MVKYCFKIVCSDFLSIVFQFLVLVNQSKHDCEPLSALALDYVKKELEFEVCQNCINPMLLNELATRPDIEFVKKFTQAKFFREKFYRKL